jgi:hypothetical protein
MEISVNIIIENLKAKLGLPKPKPTPCHLKMGDQNTLLGKCGVVQ